MKSLLFGTLLICIALSQITYEECKRDCTMDWLDCTSGCDSIGNPSYCHKNCQNVVHGCLDECPKIICIDECRIILEQCRKNGAGICEVHFNQCQLICEDTYNENQDI
ncbi:unnamed protein product (macronuclear) [Paramecium tetraurelia]|uniref:Cysteine-rich protein n=1 Tax=Paramecium tetraurelia TaxID=5888 RepID=A0CFT3_PARTE|nr:uncharacterized protein GSPATT00038091001 [Paramecium tetraurelia]CAK69650.1 unnamed protein product [Paramecium tetraurelia]|eukprot:XP_001437047.1 hypothetical protein (macronuclear) [Paramecium tetraurelia strain d4-2]